MDITVKHIYCFLFIIFFSFVGLKGQTRVIDSLLADIKTLNAESSSAGLDDTIRINTLINLSNEYVAQRNYSKAIKYATISKIMAEKLTAALDISISKVWLANAIQSIAYTLENQESYASALVQYKKELLLREEIGNDRKTAICLNKIGEIYNSQDNLDASLEYYYKALKLTNEVFSKEEALTIYNNIGIAYDRQTNYAKSLEYYNKVLELSTILRDTNTMGISYSNIGTVYAEQGKNKEAFIYYFKFLKFAQITGNKKNVAVAYLNISNIFDAEENFKKSFEMQFNAMKIFEELGNQAELALIKANIGSTYISLAKTTISAGERNSSLKEAKKCLNEALLLYQKSRQLESIGQVYRHLADMEKLSGNFEASLENYRLYIQFRDSLMKLEDNEKRIRAEMNYEFDQKESISKLEQERKQAIVKEESDRQKQIRNLFIVAFIFMVALAVFIFRSNRHKQKANKIILQQKQEVERQKALVEEKQFQIISSINYAKRIQESILIAEDEMTANLPDLFITYLPKDIVSGDFYWYSKQGNDSFIVVADCTGHGVPGAFLSMVGSTLLNEIIIHKKIYDPALIINALATSLATTLANKEKDEVNTDGMDISICRINHKTKKLSFVGANQSIYIVDHKQAMEIKPQISSINGIFAVDKTQKIAAFELILEENLMIYLTTDGYIDQIGGQNNKKFLSSRFEKLLAHMYSLSVEKQQYVLEETFEDWKGESKQIDDVLVIGFKI
ncbi:MAG: tetratricopeptide repeat protein [Bacteroidetes bacterium]|nr:tetratricopeptide repeat protein [Bacteroidota bacterium]